MNIKKNNIGVIGGLGNEAMVDLAAKIAALPGQEKHNYIFFGNSRLAFKPHEVSQDWLPTDEPELRRKDTAIHTANVMRHLGCSVTGLACNSAHELFREVMASVPVPFVDMIRETARTMRGIDGKVLVMGVTSLVDSGLYQSALEEQGVAAVKSSPENQKRIMAAIYDTGFGIKTAQITRQAEELLCRVIREECESQGCRHIILGCTELPLAITTESCARFKRDGAIPADIEVIDASSVLAETLVKADFALSAHGSSPDEFLTQYTDWFPPAVFTVPTLKHLVSIQEQIFRQTAKFLAERGQSITGSYMHVPTLFIVGDIPEIEEKLAQLDLTAMTETTHLEMVLPAMLAAHFDSMQSTDSGNK